MDLASGSNSTRIGIRWFEPKSRSPETGLKQIQVGGGFGEESHLCDARVGALAVDAIVFQPLVFGMRAVLLERAAVLAFAPHATKQRIRLQAQAAAPALGIALVQMDCAQNESQIRRRRRRRGSLQRETTDFSTP